MRRALIETEVTQELESVTKQNQMLQAQIDAAANSEALRIAIRMERQRYYGGLLLTAVVSVALCGATYAWRNLLSEHILSWAPWAVGLLAIVGPASLFELWSRRLKSITSDNIVRSVKQLSRFLRSTAIFLFLAIVGALVYDLAKPGIDAKLSPEQQETGPS